MALIDMMCGTTMRPSKHTSLLAVVFVLLNLLFIFPSCSGLEAKWTPAEGEDVAGPLPLSQNQRDQLFQLEEAIVNSPNPQETLMKVAASNQMEPQELVDLLQRNRADAEASGTAPPRPAGGGGGGGGMSIQNTLPRRVFGAFGSLFVAVGNLAKAHPQVFSVIFTALLLCIYATVQAPQTGIVLSTGPNALLLSSGHTTLCVPPAKYITKYLESMKFINSESSLPRKSGKAASFSGSLVDEIANRDMLDGTVFIKASRKSTFTMAVTAQKTVQVSSILSNSDHYDDDEEDSDDERRSILQDAQEAMYDAALSVMSSKRFSEYAPTDGNKELVRFQSTTPASKEGRKGGAVLVVRTMGDFGRYGLQPLRVAYQEETNDSTSVVYSTLKGGHFDGQIRFAVEMKADGDSNDSSLLINASLVIPKKGRKIGKKNSSFIVSTLVDSMSTSIITQAKQILARRHMSSRYRGRVSAGATERRQIRFENERKMEEMAEDRRRRWQRSNPDAGRYRPSGDRMRSPNNS